MELENESDQLAFQSLIKVRPAWTGIQRASDVLELAERSILHAGPPFSPENEIPVRTNAARLKAQYRSE